MNKKNILILFIFVSLIFSFVIIGRFITKNAFAYVPLMAKPTNATTTSASSPTSSFQQATPRTGTPRMIPKTIGFTFRPVRLSFGRKGIISIGRNGYTILRDTVVKSVDPQNYTMVVNVWGIDLNIEYGNALVVPGVTKNYKCPGQTVKNCHLSNNPEAMFFKEGDIVNITGIVKTTSTQPITIEAKRVYNHTFAKPLTFRALERRIRRRVSRYINATSTTNAWHQIPQPVKRYLNPVKHYIAPQATPMSRQSIENKINEILQRIAKIQAQIKANQGQ